MKAVFLTVAALLAEHAARQGRRFNHNGSGAPAGGAVLVLWVLTMAPAWATPVIGHRLDVTIGPARGHLEVVDTITLPAPTDKPLTFMLHEGLEPSTGTAGVRLRPAGRVEGAAPFRRYRLEFSSSIDQFAIRYGGRIRHDLGERVEGVGQRRRDTRGFIGEEGVYLSGASGWYPRFGNALVHFSMTVRMPPGWEPVSQGRRDISGTTVRWTEPQPQDDIYLVAAPYHLYRRPLPEAEAMVYLRSGDDALAQRYLEATAQYLPMYGRLLGPYPYPKFALVENFWESGYGMPSFTLLGPRVIRLPFIIHTSYPHEIVHNWWGNGVYVDYGRGNWSEGLTAYFSDHLLKARNGEGAAYRRDSLQKYAEYVAEHADQPLKAFRARHSEASQAIGYGKGLMLFHMLRTRLGGNTFLEGLRRFYREHRFEHASFDDLRIAFEAQSGEDLKWFFRQWVEGTGAPMLRVDFLDARPETGGYRLKGRVSQVQPGAAFRLAIPLTVGVEGADEPIDYRIAMAGKQAEVDLKLRSRPLWAAVDPRFDLFRRLHPEELPVSLDRLFGAERLTLVLPGDAPRSMRQAYRALADRWSHRRPEIRVRWDTEMDGLPEGAVWLFGWENRFRGRAEKALAGLPAKLEADRAAAAGTVYACREASVVLTAMDGDRPLAWTGGSDEDAVLALARKLPHYGKYSYLAFTAKTAQNRLKGQWPVVRSPLIVSLAPGSLPHELPSRPPLTRFIEQGARSLDRGEHDINQTN